MNTEKASLENENQPSCLDAVMRRFSTWYQKVTCKHTVLTFERIDYQDRYVKCKCDKCGEDVYKDI